MKHAIPITLILIVLFFAAQVFGLATLLNNIAIMGQDGIISVQHQDTIVGKPPQSASGLESVTMISIAILIGTVILLLFMKFKLHKLFMVWYFFAVFTTIAVTLGVYITHFSETINIVITLSLSIALALLKIKWKHPLIHNLTELLVYAGITVLFVSLFDKWLWSAFALLLVISVYDMFAVWKSKHMVAMAQYQQENKLFAGLTIPYTMKQHRIMPGKKMHKPADLVATRTAILGGGDIAFPLLFSGAVLSTLITKYALPIKSAFHLTLIISLFATIALTGLLIKGKKNSFYPAMPFISAGCFLGYLVVMIIIRL